MTAAPSRPVIVTTTHRGVYFGYTNDTSGTTATVMYPALEATAAWDAASWGMIGDGSGFGFGDGSGFGFGSGDGCGFSSGFGFGDGSGFGFGSGDGCGFSSGSGFGDGCGFSSGSGFGAGDGCDGDGEVVLPRD